MSPINLISASPLLWIAKATGRATRISQDGIVAAGKGTMHAAGWLKDQALYPAKLLNVAQRKKKTTDELEPEVDNRSVSKVMLSRPSAVVETPPAKTTRPSPAKTIEVPPKPKIQPPPVVKPQKVEEAKPEPRIQKAPEIKQAPPEVTKRVLRKAKKMLSYSPVSADEAANARFSGSAEKVMFSRALQDLASSNQPTRARAAKILGGIKHDLSLRALAVHLGQESIAEVRKECVNGLTSLGSKAALPVIEQALTDRAVSVRLAAVRGIYRLAGSEGAASLIGMFADKNQDVRRRAAACIGWMGQTHMAKELLPLLKERDPSVRVTALEAMGNLKASAMVDHVIELLDDPDEVVRQKAFVVLHAITGKKIGKEIPKDENGRKFLIARWRAWRESI